MVWVKIHPPLANELMRVANKKDVLSPRLSGWSSEARDDFHSLKVLDGYFPQKYLTELKRLLFMQVTLEL